MKFELSELAPSKLTRAFVAEDSKGRRVQKALSFDAGVVYDTKDFEEEFPQFAEGVLDVRQKKDGQTPRQVAEYRAIYGDTLKVNKCGVCGGTKATVLFPVFKEI